MYHNEIISTPLNFDKKTCVSINTKLGFSLVPKRLCGDTYQFHFEEVVGKFDIIKIATDAAFSKEIPYDKTTKTFRCVKESTPQIYISANVEMKKVNYVAVWYHFQISPNDMKLLEIYDYYQRVIELSGYEKFKFNCFIKKTAEGKIEVEIENLFDIRISGKRGNYIFLAKDSDIVDFRIQFIFDSCVSEELIHKPEEIKSRPDSQKLYEDLSNKSADDFFELMINYLS